MHEHLGRMERDLLKKKKKKRKKVMLDAWVSKCILLFRIKCDFVKII